MPIDIRGRSILLSLLSWLLGVSVNGVLHAAYTDPAISVKVVAAGTNINQPILTLPASGPASITLQATATNFTPTSYAWSQVPDALNTFAAAGIAGFAATNTTQPQVTVTLPTAGVYQFQVTATAGTNSASRYVWVNVWDNVAALNPNQQVGRNPGIAPPTSVRQLSLDPGPFCHPRILFSRSDWPDLSGRGTNSLEVRTAITNLQAALAANFDLSGSAMKTLENVYSNYAQGGYSGTYFTNTVIPAHANASSQGILGELILGHNPSGSYFDALLTACYLAWIGTDPARAHSSVPAATQSRFTALAAQVSTAARVELTLTNTPAAYYSLALCYDLVYDWMTTQQQNDTRDYLYATGYGYYNTGGGGISRSWIWDGHLQNGDFPNLSDGIVLPQLAIEGEEMNVTAAVTNAFGPPQPYATGPGAWPYASPAAVSNLRRLMNWNTDWAVSPWGFLINMVDYFQLGQNISAPAALALARRGEDQFTTTYYYQSSLAALYNLAPGEDGKGMRLFDHHDGLPFTPGPGQMNAAYIVKYVYPDDPMVDYVYRAFRVENENDLAQAMFASDPSNTPLATVAQQKNLALTKFDPERAVVVSRNGWGENDLNLIFENRFDQDGHMHAERNNFSLYALGRAWSSPPGYHCTINDLQATVLIQNPNFAGDPATSGYIGQSPSSATITTNNSWGPPPPGRLVEITEDPAKQWTLFAGDASPAYNWGLGTNNAIDTGVPAAQNAWPGLLTNLSAYTQSQLQSSTWKVQSTNYNAVRYALRSILTVRGTNPYVLVLDDICKDGAPQNYRWSMPCGVSFGPSYGRFVDPNGSDIYSSLTNLAGATASDITLYHLIDKGTNNQKGLPRLLVRDVTEAATTNQPPIFVENHPAGMGNTNLTYGWDNNSKAFTYVPSSRVLITRTNVISPSFKVLLFPFLSGSNLPATSWNSNNTVLIVSNSGTVDTLVFDRSNADHRTRVTSFARTRGHAAPTLTVPTNFVVAANTLAPSGQFGAAANFTVTAKDYLGATLTPSFSFLPGTILPVGATLVQVSATDALGQQSSTSFTVTVLPPPPLLWQGDGTQNAWSFGATNWLLGTNPLPYAEPVAVVFDDTGSTAPVLTLAQMVQPTSVTFSNNSQSYTIGGAGKISGTGSLTLAAPGTVTLLTSNDYSGGTAITTGATLQLGNGSADGAIGRGNVTNNGALAFNLPDTQTVSGSISGSGTLSLAGVGSLVLLTNNTYTGLTTVSGGTLQIGSGGTSGSVPTNIALTGGSLAFSRTDNYTQSGTVSGNSTNSSLLNSSTAPGSTLSLAFAGGSNRFGALQHNGSGTMRLTTPAGTTHLFSGALSIAGGATLVFNGGAFQFPNDGFANMGQSGSGGCVVSNGASVALGGGNWVNWTNLQVTGTNSVLAANAGLILLGNAARVTLANQGSLITTGGGLSLGNLFGPGYNGYQSSVTVQQSSGALSLAANNGLSLGGAAPGYTNIYALSGGTVNLLGGGGASLTLGADTSGTGLTLFSLTGTGKLLVSGTVAGSQNSGTPLQIFDFSGGTLAAGTLAMTALSATNATTTYGTLINNGGILAPGDLGTPGKTVITGNYAVSNSAAGLAIDLGGSTPANAFQNPGSYYDVVSISGTATLGGSLLVRLTNNFTVTTNTSFTILTAAGGLTGQFSNTNSDGTLNSVDQSTAFTVSYATNSVVLSSGGQIQAGFTAAPVAASVNQPVTFADSSTASGGISISQWIWNYGDGTAPVTNASPASPPAHAYAATGTYPVTLTVTGTHNTRSTVTNAFIVAARLLWKGDGTANAWNSSATNWLSGGTAATYADPAGVVFDDSGSTAPAVALAQTVQPMSVVFSNASRNYVVGGSGRISGFASLTLATPGTVTLLTSNDYTGSTVIASGATLQVGNGAVSGAIGSGSVSNNGLLAFNLPDTQTVGGNISGSGALSLAGTGTLLLYGSNTYAGPTTLNSGTLKIGNPLVPGFYEGLVSSISGADTTNPIPRTNIQSVARWGSSTTGGGNNVYPAWASATTWGYAGYIANTTPNPIAYIFGKNFDDNGYLKIDGVTVLSNTTWNAVALATNLLSPGLHTLDLRFGQGSGGVGPNSGNNFGQYGLAYNSVTNASATGGTWTQFGASDASTAFYAGYGVPGNVPAGTGLTVAGTFDLNGTAQNVNTLSGAGWVTNSGSAPATLTVSAGNFSGSLSGNLGLAVTGPGTLTLSGTNSFSGATAITNATLFVNGSLASSPVTLTNSTFGGMGAITGSLTLLGSSTLAPGAATGLPSRLTLSSNCILSNNAATLAVDIGGTNQAGPGTSGLTNYDFVSVNGSAVLKGSLAVNLTNNFIPVTNASFTVFTATNLNCAFTNLLSNRVKVPSYPNASFQVVTSATSVVLTNFQMLEAAFTTTVTNGYMPLLVAFTDISVGSATNRHWDFGDGFATNTAGTNLSHTFLSGGTNWVSLTVSGGAGSNTVSHPVVVIVNTQPPVLAQFQIQAGKVLLSGSNGMAGASYYVLSATNLALPLSNWSIISTSLFASDGSVRFTNTLNTNAAQNFYRLRLP